MSNITVILSQQDLGEFLEDNLEYMEAYRAELEKRLTKYFGDSTVEISANHLTDKFNLSEEESDDDLPIIQDIMAKMTNDWSWLPE